MSKPPVTTEAESHSIEPSQEKSLETVPAMIGLFPFFSFHYSYRQVSMRDGRTHFKSESHRFKNGTLSSESAEGTGDPTLYAAVARPFLDLFSAQTNLFLQQLSLFLSFFRTSKK